jgi:hypothetical protein
MRGVFLLITLAVLAAGCAVPAATPPAPAPGPAAPIDIFHPRVAAGASELATPKPLPDVLVDTPGFAEPNIAATFDGATLYIANPGDVWRSDDAGKSWTHPANTGLEGGGDGDVAVDANGTVYYLGLGGKDGRDIPFLRSTNKGESWSPALDVSAGTGFDREWIDVTPQGHIYATWRGSSGIEFNMSPDGGATWAGKVTVGADGDGGPVIHDPITGTLAITVVDLAETAGVVKPAVHVYTSADDGKTWVAHTASTFPRTSPAEPNGYASDFPVLSFDGNGTLYLVYSASVNLLSDNPATPPEEGDLYGTWLQTSADRGATWTAPKILSDPTKDARFPWVAAGAPGRIAVVWYENVRGLPGEMLPDEWNVKLYESLGADAGSGKSVVVTLTDKPNHLGSMCTSGAGCLAADRSLLDFFEVAIGTKGQPVVAFATSTVGTGIGIAVKSTEIHFVTVEGTSLL